jgi:Transglutaminase-like superfamily
LLGCNCQHGGRELSGTSVVPLLSGDAGVAQTIALMKKLIDDGVKDPVVNRYAIVALQTSGAMQHDPLSAAQTIFDTVSRNFFFVNDPVGPEGAKETLRIPRDTIELRAGDCDDFTVLICSLLGTIGMATRIITVASDPRDPSQFTHVYPEVDIDGEWIPVDAARPGAQFGLAPMRTFRKKIWSCTDSSSAEVAGQRFSLSGYMMLGDDPTAADLTSAAQLVTATGQQVANTILASNALPQNIYGNVTTSGSLAFPTAGYQVGAINPLTGLPYSYIAPTTISPNMILVGAALLALLLLRH